MNNFWTLLAVVVPVLAGVAGILWWLDFKPNGPRMLAGLKARIQAPRKEREELRKQVKELQQKTDYQATQIGELMRISAQQGASLKEHAKRLNDQFGLITTLGDAVEATHRRVTALETGTIASMRRSHTTDEIQERVERLRQELNSYGRKEP